MGYPGHSLTLIVKGTFDLSPGGKASIAEKQAFPTGDEYYPDDDGMAGSLRYETDFAYFKPRADLLLVGKCHPQGGKLVSTCPVTFRVGNKSRTLNVVGNRRAQRRYLRWSVTEPEPFAEMELRWENSFGGTGFKKNPVGKGYRSSNKKVGPEPLPLPNIENPADSWQSSGVEPEPAGFGPLGRTWHTRLAKMGTFTDAYSKTRWPWFPEDFDLGHFNSAPGDMQFDGYLRGDEDLFCENLHPIHSQYHCRLPGVRVRCFLNKDAWAAMPGSCFVEVPMNIDTLWVDMKAEKLVLLWRGWAEVLSEDYEEVKDIFIMSEPLDQQPAPVEQCHRLFLESLTEEEKAGAPPPEEPVAEEKPPAGNAEPKPRLDQAQLAAQLNALLGQMGIDAEKLPPEVKEQQARLFQKMGESDPEKALVMERMELDAQMRDSLGKLGLDPDKLPPLSEKAKTEQVRLLKELGIKESMLSAAPEFQQFWTTMAAVLPKAGMSPEDLSPLIEQVRKHFSPFQEPSGGGEGEDEGAKKKPVLTREIVLERAATRDSFAGEDLTGLDLSGLDLKGIDFSMAVFAGAILTNADLRSAILTDADLTGANLSGANLAGANLGGADLFTASLQGACLRNADLTKSNLSAANLSDAVLAGAVCESARLIGTILVRIKAQDALLAAADLSGAKLMDAELQRTDFSKCLLHNADFQGANLTEARVEGATGPGVNFSSAKLTKVRASERCNFSGGKFHRASGAESIWEKADLTRTDFRYARMERATFTAASLKNADMSGADMKFCRFDKADLRGAKLVQMNLFEGRLEKADLTEADISGSNMYGAEFLDAVIEKTDMHGTNLKMTKLHTN